jgi:hypothetical protein
MKPNWYESSIWQKRPSGNGSVDIRVMVAKQDLPAFKSITTEPGGPTWSFTDEWSATWKRIFCSFACWAERQTPIRPATRLSPGK